MSNKLLWLGLYLVVTILAGVLKDYPRVSAGFAFMSGWCACEYMYSVIEHKKQGQGITEGKD